MINSHNRKLVRYQVGALPLMCNIIKRMQLFDLLSNLIPRHGNEKNCSVETICLLVYNFALGKRPMYKLGDWVDTIDLRCLNYHSPNLSYTDDKFGRCLDKTYAIDIASAITEVVVLTVKNFDVSFDRVHNDSTSIKCHGEIAGETKTGFELKRGHSKDHRPDLKQLVFSLSISSDGGIPVHCKTYSGNRTDDTTHIETWNMLNKISDRNDFIYVADSKLCTDKQLNYIVSNGGRAITMIPETWGETKAFKDKLRKSNLAKHEIWRKPSSKIDGEDEYFCSYALKQSTGKRHYSLHWIHSSKKKMRDKESRMSRILLTEKMLTQLNGNLNTRGYKTEDEILKKITQFLDKYNTHEFIEIDILERNAIEKKQIGKGRPSATTQYQEIRSVVYSLSWSRKLEVLKAEAKTDGVFPLLSTDPNLTAKEVLQAYKYQPNLEKRFCQLKSYHNCAPFLFKSIHRIEASMFIFFLALMVQALLERDIRKAMNKFGIEKLDIYPENRASQKPTAHAVFELFERVSSYQIVKAGEVVESYKDELTDTQKSIIKLLGMTQEDYWGLVV